MSDEMTQEEQTDAMALFLNGEWYNAADVPGGLTTCFELMHLGWLEKRDQHVGSGVMSWKWRATPAAFCNVIDRLTAERDAAREKINAVMAIAESYESSAQNPQLEISVSRERVAFAQEIYEALGIEVGK